MNAIDAKKIKNLMALGAQTMFADLAAKIDADVVEEPPPADGAGTTNPAPSDPQKTGDESAAEPIVAESPG